MKIRSLFGVAAALLLTALNALAADIVDAAYVASALKRGAIVWDIRSSEDYAKGHIPGAINIGYTGSLLRNPNTEDFVQLALVEKLLNDGGIDLRKEVIVYSRAGDPYAHWSLTAVRHFGGKQGKVFHGGIDEWQAAGLALSKEPTRLAAVDQKLSIDPSVQVYMGDVLARIRQPDVQIIDARTAKEFSGDDIRALRGGHIPGARNVPYEQNWTDPAATAKLAKGEVKTRDGMQLKAAADLRSLYAGFDPAKETIVYCQSGVRASETANVLRDIGFTNVRIFEESWLGYGNNLAAPAERVQFVNVGALKSQISGLQQEVDALSAELAALKKAQQR